MEVDILIVVQKKGISGFRELTEHLFENLNVRTIGRHRYDNVVKDTEMVEYLRLCFGLSKQNSLEIVNGLINMGFLEVDRVYDDCRLISSNLKK